MSDVDTRMVSPSAVEKYEDEIASLNQQIATLARLKGFSTKVTPAEDERLALLLEEIGEVLQVIGKIKRHGYESHHPEFPETSNRKNLEYEIGHVVMAIELMVRKGDVNRGFIKGHSEEKSQSVKKWLHFQGEL